MRTVTAVAAVVHDSQGAFFLSYNDRWGKYAFPMQKPNAGERLDEVAVQAFLAHGGQGQPRVVQRLAFVRDCLESLGIGERTYYNYHVFELDACGHRPTGNFFFEPLPALLDSEQVSTSTKEIAQALASPNYLQESAVAVLCRPSLEGPQFLLVQNVGYGDYFFPAGRPRFEELPEAAAERAFRDDTNYSGAIEVERVSEKELSQFSERYQINQNYRFHLCKVTLPGVDLQANNNAMEQSLASYGMPAKWFSERQLANPASNGLSPTVADLRSDVMALAGDCK